MTVCKVEDDIFIFCQANFGEKKKQKPPEKKCELFISYTLLNA